MAHKAGSGEVRAGLVLLAAAAAGMLLANSPLSGAYTELFHDTRLSIALTGRWGFALDHSLVEWVNELLMPIFFLLVGLEIKREMVDGQLRTWRAASLPVFAAAGGVVVPAGIFLALAWMRGGDAPRGWAVPTATDIAFSLGALALLGSRVPPGLRVFLTALAVIDDLAAIVIIALFYGGAIGWLALGLAGACVVVLLMMNHLGVRRRSAYIGVGALLWLCTVKSGAHATLAGVVLGLCMPMDRGAVEPATQAACPLRSLEHSLLPWVQFAVLPLFALANAGVDLRGMGWGAFGSVAWGAALGLLLGKPIGVMLASGAAVRLGLAQLPEGTSWRSVAGVGALCGIGFTMSLFIATLAFEQAADGSLLLTEAKLGVIAGSLASAVLGMLWLRTTSAPQIVKP
jgi:NhaA family Na+:H+ antiporter